jgi:NADPH-dependent 2,4-dienoyl-CoA reductase/sulfur reductase-like enzyme
MVAGYAAREFVERGLGRGELAIVSADDQVPYERPPLSKVFLRGSDPEASLYINPPEFYAEHGIEVRLSTSVDRVDLENRRAHLGGGVKLGYEKLLIATGATVRKLDVPGGNLEGVFYLRTAGDALRIRRWAAGATRAVVIGGGFIGMEVAASLRQRGLEVTQVLRESRVWERLFTPEMSDYFQRYYEAHGVRFVANAAVAGFTGNQRLESVTLGGGVRIAADLVVAGVGVLPATRLFEGSRLDLRNGIRVNEYLETNLAGVYAAGDVALYRDVLFGKDRRVEHWDNAVSQGQHAARQMTGSREPFDHVPYFFSDVFDLSYELWGDPAEADRTVTRGDYNANSFSTWWLKGGRVTAAFVMNRPEEEREQAQRSIRERVEFSTSGTAA